MPMLSARSVSSLGSFAGPPAPVSPASATAAPGLPERAWHQPRASGLGWGGALGRALLVTLLASAIGLALNYGLFQLYVLGS